MLKDLMHAIFKEDVDEDEIDEVEETVTQTQEPVQETAALSEPEPAPIPVVKPIVQEPKPFFAVPSQSADQDKEESIFEGLDVDTISSRPKTRNENYHFDRSKLNRKRKLSEEVEYQAVISPIFGNMEDSQKQFDKVHDAVKLPKPETDTSMIEIISPMYGNSIPEPGPVDSIPTYDEAPKASRPKLDLDDLLDAPREEAKK